MNFLAHIYLSGEDSLIKIGNFMADGIRGKQFKNFPSKIQKGILLHHAIDTFTDTHPIFKQSTKRLYPHYSHYANVITDIFYDHFLAKNWTNYSTIPLSEYTSHFYKSLDDNYTILTEKTHHLMPYMKKENWLLRYADINGIKHILTQMDLRRTKNFSKMRLATAELVEFYFDFEQEFTLFFGELRVFTDKKIQTL